MQILGYILMYWWLVPLSYSIIIPHKCLCGDRWFRIKENNKTTCLNCTHEFYLHPKEKPNIPKVLR